jgi:nitrite reductase (NADH) large subunit
MAVGIRPNIELADRPGSALRARRRGRRHDADLRPAGLAVGECVQHRGVCYGLVAPLFEQAKVCANHLADTASPATRAR